MQSRQPPIRLPPQESEISRFANPVSEQPLHFAPLCCSADSVSPSSSVEQPWDETGVRIDGKTCWNWLFQNEDVVIHVIRHRRGADVAADVLHGLRPAG